MRADKYLQRCFWLAVSLELAALVLVVAWTLTDIFGR